MTILVLDTPNHQLSLQNDLLHIAHPEQAPRLVPLSGFERLVVGRGISLSSDLQLKCSELGKELVILGHKSSAVLINPSTAPNNLRLLQYHAVTREDIRTRLEFALLEARRHGQNRVLKRLAMPLLPPPVAMPNNLMLHEAHMSRTYWRAWSYCFKHDDFAGRERQPPQDPLNALLSLTSTLEDSALTAPLLAEGFDLTLGLHHATGYRRASLTLDIKELTRAEQELWIIAQWQTAKLTKHDFAQTEYGCRLTRSGQQKFYPAWFK
ncbi:CRISPR-associated endonuclease Cas1 [Pseudoalteromonas sp. SG43-7]|uniref:CRISPR-associated endonuclease Cas1 n=1 Tax=Pseudoalteromonas sp. SG43-7 TaxID=2760966 RepID=UPI001604975F|nr:CRISPR-associated endonuclease Cas1 [Pseudoalteromonas sp. SG43-7]MBB1420782.1 CRISPR-associated endonuclease Cas1 [Pseudoalteromonas sp. SG43-7]